jgi:hypothetical protein
VVAVSLVYGAFGCYVYINFLERKVDEFIIKLIKKQFHDRRQFLWTALMIYLLISLIPVVLYLVCDIKNPTNQSLVWTQYWYVVNESLASYNPSPTNFAYIASLMESSISGGFFGIIIGLASTHGKFDSEVNPVEMNHKSLILRVVTGLFIYAIFEIFTLISVISTPQYIIQYLISNLAGFAATYSLINILPRLYKKFNLSVEGDLLHL